MFLLKTALSGRLSKLALLAVATIAFATSSCKKSSDSSAEPQASDIRPKGSAPSWGSDMDPQMLAVIEQFIAFKTPPLPTLTPRQARMAPSVTDAVMTVLRQNNIAPDEAAVTISQQVIPATVAGSASDGTLLRIYTPTKSGTAPYPVIVYYHGGGWVIGSLDVYEPSCKALCENTGAIVVSVDYRLAPEAKFPAAHLDSYNAYVWAKNNAASINGNPAKVAVAGESAGGNMACAVSLMAKNAGFALPIHQLLVYPVANNDLTTASYQQYGADAVQPLNKANVMYFTDKYFKSMADGDSSLISLVDVADLTGLPPATVIAAEIDPLQTEGKQLSDKLGASYTLYQGTTHEFFGTYQAVPKAQEAQTFAAQRLMDAFK